MSLSLLLSEDNSYLNFYQGDLEWDYGGNKVTKTNGIILYKFSNIVFCQISSHNGTSGSTPNNSVFTSFGNIPSIYLPEITVDRTLGSTNQSQAGVNTLVPFELSSNGILRIYVNQDRSSTITSSQLYAYPYTMCFWIKEND